MVKGVVINDIHFGIKESKRLYEELSQFKDFIKNRDDLDLLIIDGDYFDCKLSIGDSATYYAMTFFNELVKLVKEKHLIFRMVQGTRSHELNQLQLFKPFESDIDMNFKIIETAQEEELLDLHILYLPEEYPENADEYYKEYKTKQYNIIFGHGTWNFVAQPGQIELSKKDVHTAPVFMWDEWKDTIPDGFISFGHIHGRNKYGKKIFYSGSFSRWNYGEPSEKGFTYFEYDLENLTYDVKFINNDMAPEYDSIAVRELGIDLDSADVSILQEALDSFIKEPKDNLRIDLSGLSKEKINILKEHYKPIENVKIEVRDEKKSLLKESTINKEEFKKWHYITKRQLPLNETVKKYCEEEKNIKLDIKEIDGILKDE